MNLPLVEFAPMEGITDGLLRKLHSAQFGGIARYYTPFLSPTDCTAFTVREKRLLEPVCANVVPQILTKNPEPFRQCAAALHDLGFQEVNLNLGCPSGTVTAKGKGAALLGDLPALRTLLDGIFTNPVCSISIKTRLGLHVPEEFSALMALFREYPICRLALHLRTKDELYAGAPHLEILRSESWDAFPVSVNGSFRSVSALQTFRAAYPEFETVMIGRGLLINPALAREWVGGQALTRDELRSFSQALADGYKALFGSDRNASFRMKELWFYFAQNFDAAEKPIKEIRRAKTLSEIQAWGKRLLDDCPFHPEK